MQEKKQNKPTLDELRQYLREKGVNLSHQRLKVLEYLFSHKEHLSADQIYRGLRETMVTLSKTTVYNTLGLLAEAGVIRPVTIEDYEVRYDIVTHPHGHFKCQNCGRIYNFEIDSDALAFHGLEHFQIQQKDVYFKGICSECLPNQKNTRRTKRCQK